jgi:hypothetical protein
MVDDSIFTLVALILPEVCEPDQATFVYFIHLYSKETQKSQAI